MLLVAIERDRLHEDPNNLLIVTFAIADICLTSTIPFPVLQVLSCSINDNLKTIATNDIAGVVVLIIFEISSCCDVKI